MMSEMLSSPIIHGALSGLLAAGVVDYHAFMRCQTFKDVVAWDWSTAGLRWIQGAIAGAVSAIGLGWVT